MLTLPTWLALYLCSGLAVLVAALTRAERPVDVPRPTWLGAAVAVVIFAFLWPLFVVRGVARR